MAALELLQPLLQHWAAELCQAAAHAEALAGMMKKAAQATGRSDSTARPTNTAVDDAFADVAALCRWAGHPNQ